MVDKDTDKLINFSLESLNGLRPDFDKLEGQIKRMKENLVSINDFCDKQRDKRKVKIR